MPVGDTISGALADSLDVVLASARLVREFKGVMPNIVDKVTLEPGTGLAWREVSLAQLIAQNVTETTTLNNPQQAADTLFTVTPTVSGIHTFITDRVAQRLSKKAFGKLGGLAQNALQRKKDEDGLTVLDGATTSLSGAGTTLASGVIDAAKARISSNVTEPGNPPYRTVLHGFQIKDIQDEVKAGVGTYPIGEGLTAKVFAEGFTGMVGGTQLYEDGNITIDASDDAKGGVFCEESIVLVQGHALEHYTRVEPDKGGGGNSLWIYDEYAYGERSAGNWLFEIFSDALAPTS
jgi:hypothetical protein